MIDIHSLRGGHSLVRVIETGDTGFVTGTNLDGIQVHLSTGKLAHFKATELELAPKPEILQIRHDLHSELTKNLGRHAEDHEVNAALARKLELDRKTLARSAPVTARGSVPEVPQPEFTGRSHTWPLGS